MVNDELWMVNDELWIMNDELWIMNYELWIMNYESIAPYTKQLILLNLKVFAYCSKYLINRKANYTFNSKVTFIFSKII